MVMRPQDMVEYNRRSYSYQANVNYWSKDELIDEGLYPDENNL